MITLMDALIEFALDTPYFILYGVGIICSLLYWNRCPKACALALAGNILLLVGNVCQTLSWYAINTFLIDSKWMAGDRVWVYRSVAFVWTLWIAFAMALILAAVFTGRQKANSSTRLPEPSSVGGKSHSPNEHQSS